MAKMAVGAFVVTLLAVSFGSGYGVHLLQTNASLSPRIADQSNVSLWPFVIGVNVAQAVGGSANIATRKVETEGMLSSMKAAAFTTFSSGMLPMAFIIDQPAARVEVVTVGGSPVVYAFINALSTMTDWEPGRIGLQSALLSAFQGLQGWNNGIPYLVTLAAGSSDAISQSALSDGFETWALGTPAPTPTESSQAAASGDPHLMTMRGERFDIMQAGTHMLLQIPRGAVAETSLLAAEARAERSSAACSDLYFKSLNLTGRWADELNSGGFRFFAGVPDARIGAGWLHINKVDVKVRWGRTGEGVEYLNVFFRHLGMAGSPVGGLLGEDDHSQAATPDPYCAQILSLSAEDGELDKASVASMAQ